MDRRIAVGTADDKGRVVVIETITKTLNTEPCPQCGNPVVQGEKFCRVCGFNMMAD